MNPGILTDCVITTIYKSFSVYALAGIVIMLVLLLLSALASGSEMAFFSLNPPQLQEIKSRKGVAEQRVLKLLENPRRLLATILIFNNFVNIGIVIISTYVTQSLFDFSGFQVLGFVFQFIIVTGLILFFGEILPKILAAQHPVKYAIFISGMFPFLIKLFYPISAILVGSTGFLEKRVEKRGHKISLNELNEVIEIASESDTQEQEKDILKGIVKFGDLEVKEVMRSRVDVTAVDYEMSFPDLMKLILESGYSRLPVYQETLDHIKGLLYIKDLLPWLGTEEHFAWQQLIRPALFIPENKGINDLLVVFKEKKIHLAIVVDEFGGTLGIVTLEDIIEEIVGDINDEYDVEPADGFYTKIADNTYIFEAKTSINDFIKVTDCDSTLFDEFEGAFDSLGGFVLEITGKIPKRHEKVNYKNLHMRIESADNRRIKQIRVHLSTNSEESLNS